MSFVSSLWVYLCHSLQLPIATSGLMHAYEVSPLHHSGLAAPSRIHSHFSSPVVEHAVVVVICIVNVQEVVKTGACRG